MTGLFRIRFWPALLLVTALGMTACNTIEGVGEDLQAGGKALKDAAT